MKPKQCQYCGPDGYVCEEKAEIGDYCYWHDKTRQKNSPEVVERLQARARTGVPMVGFYLRKADLSGIDLVNHNHKEGFQLIHSDLYRCDLSNAHLFHVDFTGTSLMKAKLSYANLNCAVLKDVNLLGVQLDQTKLENVQWDQKVRQEYSATKAKSSNEKLDYYEQSEEIYRNLRKATEAQGLFEMAGHFFKREMIMRRYQLPKKSFKRILSKLVDLFCGYGEEPVRVVFFSLITIFTFALLFFVVGITDGEDQIRASFQHSFWQNTHSFFQALYFSVVTFTTLGYGDLAPIGWARVFSAIEAFIGSFTLALFVVVFVKKMTR